MDAVEQNTAVDKVEDKVNDSVSLGGNIELIGFKQVSLADVVVVKKLVGHYTRKIQEHSQNFEKIQIFLKEIHKVDNNAKHEIHVKVLDSGKALSSEVVDKNLFTALDSALKKVLGEVSHHNNKF
jgi:ribosome-associated translation inhibitor RaiA